ncbi:MAG: hypothetical protein GQ574_23055 [Crocinitomix sp.]|nr:hypothetical protein [Crocinitomix sp.]
MNINQELINEETGKSFNISLSGKSVITKTGNRENEKEYPSEAKAELEFQKKRWEKLKKGFVFKTEELEIGKARVHRYLGLGNTGCFSLVNMDDKVAVYKHNDFKNELLQVFDSKGNFVETIDQIKGIPWNLKFSKKYNALFMNVDHYVVKLDLANKEFEYFTEAFDQPASFISLATDYLFYGSAPMVHLKDLRSNEIIFSKKVEVELYSGHSSQLQGGISLSGEQIALCSQAGKIEILDRKGQLLKTIQGDFEMVDDIEFLNDSTILINEKYGTHGLRLYDINTGEELPYPFNKDSFDGTLVDCLDINRENNKILVACRAMITVYDLRTFELLQQFKIEHVVKRGDAAFMGDSTIAVRTDYGCFSLYCI